MLIISGMNSQNYLKILRLFSYLMWTLEIAA